MAAHEEGEVGFEEGMAWLPSQVLDEACDYTKVSLADPPHIESSHDNFDAYSKLQQHHRGRHDHHHHHHPNSKSSSRHHIHKAKFVQNWASGGPGMQAFFLDSSQRSCTGTGVFLPQRSGTNFHPTKKPACAPVLLPSRVVQALNLNVHALSLQISPRPDPKDHKGKSGGGDCMSARNKNGSKEIPSAQCYIIQNQTCSPELFLPKEWTY